MKLLARFLSILLLVTIVLLAVAVGTMRLAIVNIEYFKSEIEYLIARDVSPAIVFTGLSGAMDRLNPILRIENVSINLPDRSQPLLVDFLEVEFDFWASLREHAPVVLEVAGQLEKIELVKDADGSWWISDYALAVDADRAPVPEFKRLLAWVPRYLRLDLNRLIVRDRETSTIHQLERVGAQINHQQDQFFVRFGAELPDSLGTSLLLKSVIGAERSLVYVNSSALRLIPVAELLDIDSRGLQQGVLDGELWINMAGFDVLAVNGDMILNRGIVQMAADKNPLQLSFHSRFSAIDRGSDWQVTSWFDRLKVNERDASGFRSQIQFADDPGNRQIAAWVDRMPVANLPVVAGQWLPEKINTQISAGDLQGRLENILFHIDLDRPEAFRVSARALDLTSKAVSDYPGVSGLDADILLGDGRIGLRAQGSNLSLDFGDHFNAPLLLDRLEFEAAGELADKGFLLSVEQLKLANRDVKATGRLWLEADGTNPPFAFIRTRFSEGRGSSTSKYIPRRFMPRPAQEWLDRGIKNGFVPAGEMQYHGRLRDMRELEPDKAVSFYVDFRLEDGEVLFDPEWLPARNASGHVLFHNLGVTMDFDRVSYDRVEGASARAVIANFKAPELELRILTDNPADTALRSWIATPVGRRFHEVAANFQDVEGRVRTDIEIGIPLTGGKPEPQVKLRVELDEVAAHSQNWHLDLTGINGYADVVGEAISARQIDARYFGDPIKVDIRPDPASGDTWLVARGGIESKNLLHHLPSYVGREVSGNSDWQVELGFAHRQDPKLPYLRVRAESNLENTGIGLPMPMGKPATAQIPFSARIDLFSRHIGFEAALGERVRGRGRLKQDGTPDGRVEWERLDIGFSTAVNNRQPLPGMHVYGSIEQASIDDWIRFLKSSDNDNPGFLQSADLRVDQAEMFGRRIDGLYVRLDQRNRRFEGLIDAAQVTGEFNIPLHPTPLDPAVIDLGYLQIDELEGDSNADDIEPGELVDFRLSSKALLYHGMYFEDLLIDARVSGERLIVSRLGLRRDSLVLEGYAQWDYHASSGVHVSSIVTSIEGPGLGQAVKGIGFGDSISGGTLNFQGAFSWPSSIMSLDLERLSGDAELTILDGVLNNVEPGTGRYVGLFSISALPRRLALDFSDMVVKGMEFSRIDGSFRINEGVLYTNDMQMEGPAATIRIRGKTAIPQRTYDQRIFVTPEIGSTLPVIGAVSAGATVGWGLLLLQNLFKKVIDDAVEIEYQVSGSWDDPKIELIRAVDENQQDLPNNDR